MNIRICSIETAVGNNANLVNTRHRQEDLELVWINSGTGVHIVNNESYPLCPHVLYAALPGQQHELYVDVATRGYLLSFKPNPIREVSEGYILSDELSLFQYFSRMPTLSLQADQAHFINGLLPLLEAELNSSREPGQEIVNKYMQLIQLYLRRHIDQFAGTVARDRAAILFNRFQVLLEHHFKQQRSVVDYAALLHVTPNYLNQAVKKASGYSARQHIQLRVVQEAKRKARHSGSSMKEVAYDLGFHNAAHFSKYFKSMSGMNFTDFKRAVTSVACI